MCSKILAGLLLEKSLKETGKGHASDFLPERYREADGRGKKCHVQWSEMAFHSLDDFTIATQLHIPKNTQPGAIYDTAADF